MSDAWPVVPLREVLSLTIDAVPVDATASYPIAGVYSFGRGLLARGPLSGTETTYKVFHRLHENDFVLSQLKAWEGALARVPKSFDNWYLSPQFPTFRTILDRLDVRYLEWYCKQRVVWQKLRGEARGMGARRDSVSPAKFLSLTIPLPPLCEQRRIVTRIEELAAKIEEARGLRRKAVEETETFLATASDLAFRPKPGWAVARIGDFCEQPQYGYTESASSEPIGPRFLRITDIQNGQVNWDRVPFCHCPNPQQYLLQENDLVFARTGATTGKSFVIRSCPEAIFASYLIRLRVKQLVSVDYLSHYFQTSSYWAQIADEKKGTGQPNLNGTRLANLQVPIALQEEQQQIVAYLDDLRAKIDSLKQMQAETAAELDALLPSVLDKAFSGEL